MNNKPAAIQALRDAAHEIRSLRRQIVEVKAEAWDVHSQVIHRICEGSQCRGVCAAHQAEAVADELDRFETTDVPDFPPR